MLDQNHRNAEIGNTPQKPAQFELVGPHQSGRRFVQQQDLRAHRQRAGDFDEAAVDMRQVAGGDIQAAAVIDELEQSGCDPNVVGQNRAAENNPPSFPRRSATSTLSTALIEANNLVV